MDYVLICAVGFSLGSFLNVVIDRLPRGESIVWGPSRCDHCKKRLRWFELIPVISYVLQRGTCRRCHARLSIQYPLIELATAIGFVLLYAHALPAIELMASLSIFCILLCIFVIDWKTMIIPDSLTGIALIMTVLFAFVVPSSVRFSHGITAAASGGFFYTLYVVTRGQGLGFGDVKLSVVLGLLLGYPNIVIALYIAFLTGATWGVILLLIRHAKMKSRIAFGPFLIIGTAIAYLSGHSIYAWWLTLL